MSRSVKIARLFSIDLYIHWSFLLLPLMVLFLTPRDAPFSLLFYLGVFLAIFACVVMHEYGHALMARYYGIRTRDITLYPIGGVARLERMSEKPWEELWIAVAGPAVNVLLAIPLFVLWMALVTASASALDRESIDALHNSDMLVTFVAHLFGANMVLVLFNMLPAFPMDGGRVFRALLSMGLGHLQATRIAVAVGIVVALLFGIGLTWYAGHPMPLLVAVFVFVVGQQELYMVEMRHRRQHKEEEEPAQALPSAGLSRSNGMVLDLRPRISVYTWDNGSHRWVPEQPSWHHL